MTNVIDVQDAVRKRPNTGVGGPILSLVEKCHGMDWHLSFSSEPQKPLFWPWQLFLTGFKEGQKMKKCETFGCLNIGEWLYQLAPGTNVRLCVPCVQSVEKQLGPKVIYPGPVAEVRVTR